MKSVFHCIDAHTCGNPVRLVKEGGIPFIMKLEDINVNKGVLAMKRASKIAKEKGISDMTLDEINAEIAEARK